MPRGPSRQYPAIPVVEAAQLAQTIRDNNAGRPVNRILLAEALGRKPSSTTIRDLISASGKYGFTSGNYHSDKIELTDLGERLTKPRSQEERLEALREGMRNIALFNQILVHFNNEKLPDPEFLKNTLERDPFNVKPEWSQEAAEVFTTNGREVGFIRVVGGSPYVILESGPPTEYEVEAPSEQPEFAAQTGKTDNGSSSAPIPINDHGGVDLKLPQVSPPATEASVPVEPRSVPPESSGTTPAAHRQFFIAHGWDTNALQEVQHVLSRFGIPFVVAQDEPNSGRPISQKVRDLIKSCSAGIFIFSADEEFKDKDGNTIWRPRENVIFELGAGSLEYGQRIVVFKEKSVYFPTDFRDIGYIEYEKGNIQAKAMELLSELVALKAVRITPGS